MQKPNFTNYGQYSNDNYGAHTLMFRDPQGNQFYFSYQTLVAFKPVGEKLLVRENVWGPTTGKHLNWIDGGNKADRLTKEEFNKEYKKYFSEKVA